MATCKDCIHYDVCYKKPDHFDDLSVNGGCKDFADKSRYIELPCNVGDVVYQVTRNFISEFRVRFVEIATCGNVFLHTDLISGIIYTGEVFSESDIGKTVFLTREKAEKALKERESDNG